MAHLILKTAGAAAVLATAGAAHAQYADNRGNYDRDERSYYNQEDGSYNSQDGYYTQGRGYYTRDRGYYNRDGSYYNSDGSYYNSDGSYRSRDGSYRNSDGTYRNSDGTYSNQYAEQDERAALGVGEVVREGYPEPTDLSALPREYRSAVPLSYRSRGYAYTYDDDSIYVVNPRSGRVLSVINLP